ncbi:MAG: hypothetical protein DYG89_29015 [Caldilinea sp. CFX5]|nr:hypothetical protein [Caldilinea sp. CFX5]
MPRLAPQNERLTGGQLKSFCNALLDAYAEPAAFDQMLQFNLSKRLANLSLANTMPDIVFDVVNQAEREAWSRELLDAALTANPHNPALLAFAQQIETAAHHLPQPDPTQSQVTMPAAGEQQWAEQATPHRAAKGPVVLFDEAHGQGSWWGIAPTLDQGYQRLAAIVREQGATEFLAVGDELNFNRLRGCQALVLAIGPHAQTKLIDQEIQAIRDFVRRGGGLLALGTYTGDWHHEANLNRLLEGYGIAFNRDVVMPPGAQAEDCFRQGRERKSDSSCAVQALPTPPVGPATPNPGETALLAGITATLTLSSCSLYVNPSLATVLLASAPESELWEPVPVGIGIYIQDYIRRSQGPACLVAAAKTNKVVVAGGWKMFLDDFIRDSRYANEQLFRNILKWWSTR